MSITERQYFLTFLTYPAWKRRSYFSRRFWNPDTMMLPTVKYGFLLRWDLHPELLILTNYLFTTGTRVQHATLKKVSAPWWSSHDQRCSIRITIYVKVQMCLLHLCQPFVLFYFIMTVSQCIVFTTICFLAYLRLSWCVLKNSFSRSVFIRNAFLLRL